MKKLQLITMITAAIFSASPVFSSDISDYLFNRGKDTDPFYRHLSFSQQKSINEKELLNADIGKDLIKRAGLNRKNVSSLSQIQKRYSLIGTVNHYESIKLVSIKPVSFSPDNPEQFVYMKKIVLVKGDLSEDTKKNEVISMFGKIKDFIGTSYKKGGEGLSSIDCSNLVKKVFASLGIEMPRVSRSQFNMGKKIDVANLIPGDLVFFKIRKNSISHVGIYLGDDKFVHASPKKGVVISDINDKYFKKYFVGATRVISSEAE